MGIYLILYERKDTNDLDMIEDGNTKYGYSKSLKMCGVAEESEGFEFYCDVKSAYRLFTPVLLHPDLRTDDIMSAKYHPNSWDTYGPYSRPKDCDAMIEIVTKMEFEDEYAKDFSLKLLGAMKANPNLYWFISY